MQDISIDVIDRALLEQLQTDASLSNQDLALRLHLSPATCLRRVKRLRNAGLIEREVAILNPARVAASLGHGVCAIVEITLDRQDTGALELFERFDKIPMPNLRLDEDAAQSIMDFLQEETDRQQSLQAAQLQ